MRREAERIRKEFRHVGERNAGCFVSVMVCFLEEEEEDGGGGHTFIGISF